MSVPSPTRAPLRTVVDRLLAEAPQPAVALAGWPPALERADDAARTVILVVDDVAELRRAVSALPDLGRMRAVGAVVATAAAAVTLDPSPAWPPLLDLDARLERPGGAATTLATFARTLDPRPVLVALARAAGTAVRGGPLGVWAAGAVVPPLDPLFAGHYDPVADCPPDALVMSPGDSWVRGAGPEAGTTGTTYPAVSAVTGRAPAPIDVREAGEPLDEAVFNPVGFRRRWTRGMVPIAPGTRLTPSLVAGLRDAQGALLSPDAEPSLAAGLAMSAVPLERVDDETERERHAVRARRAAMLAHSTAAWRARLGAAAGVRHELLPGAVTISARPGTDETDRIDLALARRWSGADLVVMPDDERLAPERWLAPHDPLPAGATCHAADTSPEAARRRGGTVYVTRAAGRG